MRKILAQVAPMLIFFSKSHRSLGDLKGCSRDSAHTYLIRWKNVRTLQCKSRQIPSRKTCRLLGQQQQDSAGDFSHSFQCLQQLLQLPYPQVNLNPGKTNMHFLAMQEDTLALFSTRKVPS